MKKYLGILLALSFSSSLWAGATFSRAKDWVDQEVLTAADLNAEFNNILNNLDPAGIDDYSLSLSQMQSVVDPYPAAVESLATDLKGEIERIRYQILQLKKSLQTVDSTYWYQDTPTQGTFTIKASSVGVNNVSPTASLDVTGGTRLNGDLLVTGNISLSYPLTVISAESDGQTLSVGSLTNLRFATEVVDRNSEFVISTFTVVASGYYKIDCVLEWSSTGSGVSLAGFLYKNTNQEVLFNATGGTATSRYVTPISYCDYLTAGDTIYIRAQPSGATAVTVIGNSSRLVITRIQ